MVRIFFALGLHPVTCRADPSGDLKSTAVGSVKFERVGRPSGARAMRHGSSSRRPNDTAGDTVLDPGDGVGDVHQSTVPGGELLDRSNHETLGRKVLEIAREKAGTRRHLNRNPASPAVNRLDRGGVVFCGDQLEQGRSRAARSW